MYFKLAIYVIKVFLKVPKNACFSAKNESNERPEIAELKKNENDSRGPSNVCGILFLWYKNPTTGATVASTPSLPSATPMPSWTTVAAALWS